MWLIDTRTLRLQSFEGDRIPPYAILSHRWENDEVTFKDMQKQRCQDQKGYRKIQACCKQALIDNLEYAWVDTCCIDKRSSAELSEAINSMFRWYQRSTICYAFLSDVKSPPFTESLWFTRGWTLQELLAPKQVLFFNSEWRSIGSKVDLKHEIASQTSIALGALVDFDPAEFCVAQKMTWAANRYTTRVEDRAYSLLGLFQINMPLLYGEAENAFLRLQQEIMAVSNDTSIFLTSGHINQTFGMLGNCPESFNSSISCGHPEPGQHPLGGSSQIIVGNNASLHETPFTYTKLGVAGTFDLIRFALNVYILDLCPKWVLNWKKKGLFVQWNSDSKQFQRIAIDDKHIVGVYEPWNSSKFDRIGSLEITIGRLPLKIVDLSPSVWMRRNCLFMLHQAYTISAAVFTFSSTARMDFDPGPRILTRGGSYSSDIHKLAICIGQVNQSYGEDMGDPTFIVDFGEDPDGRPTIFVTKASSKPPEDKRWTSRNHSKLLETRRSCLIAGHFWRVDVARINSGESEKSHGHRMVELDSLSESDYRLTEYFLGLLIHFVRQGDKWRAYLECRSNYCDVAVPAGWILPADRRVTIGEDETFYQPYIRPPLLKIQKE